MLCLYGIRSMLSCYALTKYGKLIFCNAYDCTRHAYNTPKQHKHVLSTEKVYNNNCAADSNAKTNEKNFIHVTNLFMRVFEK